MNLIKKFPEYKTEIIRMFFNDPANATSGEVWKYLKKQMGEENAPSRASVIFFLNDLVEAEYLKFMMGSGKGGFHRIYFLDISNDDFINLIYKKTQEQLDGIIKGLIKN